MKKSASYFLILNLVLSTFAICFLINLNFVSANGESPKKEVDVSDVNTPSNTGTPTKITGAAKTLSAGAKTYVPKETTAVGLTGGKTAVVESFSKNLDGTTWTVNYKGGVDKAVSQKTMQEELKLVNTKGEAIGNLQSQKYPYAGEWYGGPLLGHISEGLMWSAMVVGMIQLVGMFTDDDQLISAASKSAFGGIMSGKTAVGIITKFKPEWGAEIIKSKWGMGLSKAGAVGLGTGLAVAAIMFYMTYKSEETETKIFTCEPWQAPTGGSNCEKCNKQGGLPCSEYQCRSLGQSCELLNPGTEEESCTWVNRHDVNPPVIKPLNDALLDGYVYAPDNTISPPDKGVKVQNTALASKCAEAFTPLTFGIITNEPAQCKISPLREKSFEEMGLYFGGSNLFTYNHTQVMVLPGADTLNASGITIKNYGNFEVFTRCQDANGNSNTANFVFKYCVEKGPDTTPPLIVSTNLLNNMPIAFDQSSIDLEIYTNEPADCRWDYLDKAYDNMDNTFTCSKNIFQMNAQMLYPCSTTLTGLKNEFENKFYFRCKDLSENTNAESYLFTLLGTRPLVIDYVSPDEETIKDSTDIIQVTLKVETSAGYNDGESACYYSDTGEDDSYVMFGNTNSHQHSQELWFNAGTYKYFIKCLDLGGNTDEKTINFEVESDSLSPLVVRVYHEGSYLKLMTNEEAECVYDTTSCSYTFEDGIKIANIDGITHYTDWDTQTNFYIKCKDSYGNKPFPDKCNIIAKPAQIF